MEKVLGKSFLASILIVSLEQGVSGQAMATFTKEVTCKLQERLDLGSADLKIGEVSGLVKCAAACVDQCSGVSVDEDNNCYHHKDSNETISCFANDVLFQFYRKNPCENDGVWDPVGLTCQCVGGWVGYRCERYPNNCGEMITFGYPDAVQKATVILPEHSFKPFLVYCSYYRSQQMYTTYIFTNKGWYDNTLTWDDYVNGFYHDNYNYWIGLEKIKILNDAGSSLLYLRSDLNIQVKTRIIYTFNNFRIGPASTDYNFTATDVKGNYDNCLTLIQGVPFSTADRDNDQDSSNCARDGKAGWWFKTCDVGCNPLGPKTYWKFTGLNLETGNATIDMYFRNY